MFIKKTTENETQYTAETGNVLKQIIFDKEYHLNILQILGNFRNCPNLQALDKGVLGNIQVSNHRIRISTRTTSRDELVSLFDIIETYEPEFAEIKTDLIDSISPGVRLPSTTPVAFSSLGRRFPGSFHQPSNVTKPIEYNQDDVKAMFPRLTDSDLNNGSSIGGLQRMTTVNFESGRTTKAHYSSPDFRNFDQIDVCRTTITQPDSKVDHIELRYSPRREYQDESVSKEKNDWAIVFKLNEDALAFFDTVYRDQSIINAQERIDQNEFFRYHFGKIVVKSGNVIRFECEVSKILEILNKSGFCPNEAIQYQQEQVEQMLNPGSLIGFKAI